MKQLLLALVLVAGCGAGGDQANQARDKAAEKAKAVVQTAGLTGLYESSNGPRPNQMCVIDRGTGNATFGIVVWGANMHSCSGAGNVVKEGNVLRLTMTGDQSCTLDARVEGGRVTLPAQVPQGCSYYCGARAQLGGAEFTLKGGTIDEAMKAVDLVGEPLCGGLSGQ